MKVYLVYAAPDEGGEVEGMFRDDGTLLGCWSLNDAHWRSEYFNHFMKKLGIKIESSEDHLLIEKLMKEFE